MRARGKYAVVLSARFPTEDIERIDALIEAGIFDSRSEALTFFVHESLKSTPKKGLSQRANEIRRMRERMKERVSIHVAEGTPVRLISKLPEAQPLNRYPCQDIEIVGGGLGEPIRLSKTKTKYTEEEINAIRKTLIELDNARKKIIAKNEFLKNIDKLESRIKAILEETEVDARVALKQKEE